MQAFSREDENIEQFRASNAANRDANVQAQVYTSALAPSLEALSYVIWPKGVNAFLEACEVWHRMMVAGDIEPVRVLKHGFIPVCRRNQQQNNGAFLNPAAAQLQVVQREAAVCARSGRESDCRRIANISRR